MVRIFVPTPYDDEPNADWTCLAVIAGGDTEHELTVWGVDALQALTLALRSLAPRLRALERERGLRLDWLGQEDLGLG